MLDEYLYSSSVPLQQTEYESDRGGAIVRQLYFGNGYSPAALTTKQSVVFSHRFGNVSLADGSTHNRSAETFSDEINRARCRDVCDDRAGGLLETNERRECQGCFFCQSFTSLGDDTESLAVSILREPDVCAAGFNYCT